MFKIDNIIILAAGRGTRMNTLCDVTPKPLLPINKKPMIESIIEYFRSRNMHNIYIITGYKSTQFQYLKNKYNINIIYNNIWENNNNISSILAAKDILDNTLIINGDVVINKDCIKFEYDTCVSYCEINKNINEWAVHTDSNNNILDFDQNNNSDYKGLYQREVSVVSREMSNAIRAELKNINLQQYYEYFILNCAKKYNIDFKPYIIESNAIYDIDNEKDYCNKIKNN